jgi:hypothetical protein
MRAAGWEAGTGSRSPAGIALGDNLRRAGKTCHELAERYFNFHHDARAARRDQRHVTAELNGIAKSLFAVQQDRLAGDIVRSEPERLRKIARRDSSRMEPCGATHIRSIHVRSRR